MDRAEELAAEAVPCPYWCDAERNKRRHSPHCWIHRRSIVAAAIRKAVADALEKAAKVAERPYDDAVGAYGPDEPFAVAAKIALAIRALKRGEGEGGTDARPK